MLYAIRRTFIVDVAFTTKVRMELEWHKSREKIVQAKKKKVRQRKIYTILFLMHLHHT